MAFFFRKFRRMSLIDARGAGFRFFHVGMDFVLRGIAM